LEVEVRPIPWPCCESGGVYVPVVLVFVGCCELWVKFAELRLLELRENRRMVFVMEGLIVR
jgi:hypothetical protein